MKKPVIYYQFDYDMFRKGQYAEGYFNYKDNHFAKSYENEEKVFDRIEKYIINDFAVDDKFMKEHRNYFRFYDDLNCERVYEMIKNL